MVANRAALAPDPTDDETPRYAVPLDQEHARYNPGTDSFEVFTQHEAFAPRRRWTRTQKRELAIKQAALRIASGTEARSFRQLAREIGCSHQAIDKALMAICDRIGIRKFHVTDAHRSALSKARRRNLAKATAR